ncbi:MAG: hypothetical protein KGS60_06920 [Verrucomicrobia bacterium]|nr:hypothetical protein [Verrucomicrobiota bacterium]
MKEAPKAMRAVSFLLLFAAAAGADEPDFYRDVYPFLKENCVACHNKTTTKAGLNMETPALMRKGGDSGPALIPGKGAESLVVEASLHTPDLEMPPKNNKAGATDLTPAQIALLKTWIDLGAKDSIPQTRQVVWQPLPVGTDPIYTVALTRDGRFAACGRSNNIQVYDLATRRLVPGPVDPGISSSAHRALVQSLAFSPDGNRLASGSFREVKIWKRQTPAPAARPASTALVLTSLAADGTALAGLDATGTLFRLDPVTGAVRQKIPGVATTKAQHFALSPDGTKAAVIVDGASLAVWDLVAGTRLPAPAPTPAPASTPAIPPAPVPAPPVVRAMAWTKDGRQLVTAGEDKGLRLWPLTAPGQPVALPASPVRLTALLAAPAPDQMISAGEDHKIRLFSLSTGKILREFATPGAVCLHLGAEGKQLVSAAGDGSVRLWDFASGKELAVFRGSLAEQQRLAALSEEIAAQTLEQAFQKAGIARLEAQNKALDELLKKANETVTAQQKLLPEKEKPVQPARAATATAQKALDDAGADEAKRKAALEALQKVQMAQVSAESAFAAVKANIEDARAEGLRITTAKAANATAISAANTALATSVKTQAAATAASTALQQTLAKGSGPVVALALSVAADRLAALSPDGTLRVWATASGTPVEQRKGAPSPAGSLAARADGTFTAASAKGDLLLTAPGSGWVLERLLTGFADQVNAVRFSPDGKLLATGGGEPSRSGEIIVFDPATGKAVQTWKERHADAVLCLDFSPDGRHLASGAADKIARVTEIATGRGVGLFEGHTHYVMGVSFRADGRVLATAGADGTVVTWDMILGERKKKIDGWRKEVTSVQFLGATNQLVTSAGDNLVRIVTDDGGQIRSIANLPDFMQSAAFSAATNAIVAGGEDSVLRVWNGADGKELAAFGVN